MADNIAMDMTSGLDHVVRVTDMYMKESRTAKQARQDLDKKNLDMYHFRQDFSHKTKGQSREFLGKQTLAVEQISSFFVQGLTDIGEFFSVEAKPGIIDPVIRPEEVRKITQHYADKEDLITLSGDAVKTALLQSIMVFKVHGRMEEVPGFEIEQKIPIIGKKELKRRTKSKWTLAIDLIEPDNYFFDPDYRGRGHRKRYELIRSYMDFADLLELAKADPSIDTAAVKQLQGTMQEDTDREITRSRETGQSQTQVNFRKKIKIVEGWGDVIDPNTGEITHKNVTWMVANDHVLIKKPVANPFWHKRSPIVVTALQRVPFSATHRAIMDAPSVHNHALNEMYNLILDAGMMATHGIKQLRSDWVENEHEYSNGIPPGATLKVASSAPVGQKVLERVDTASMSKESIDVFNLLTSEFNQSAFTNDLRLGQLPPRTVKATEVQESTRTINSVFNSMVKMVENSGLEKVLELGYLNTIQFASDWDTEEIKALIGDERALFISNLTPQERFAASAQGFKFKVFGISRTLAKQQDFRKLTALMQTIATNPLFLQSFMRKYSFEKMLNQIMRALDINVDQLAMDEQELARVEAAMAEQRAAEQGPDAQSQIPQAAAGPENENTRTSGQTEQQAPPAP